MNKDESYSVSFTVDQTPAEVFAAIVNVRGWWSEEIEGNTSTLGDEFLYHFSDVHRCKIKITDLVENKRVVWYILDNYFNFTKDTSEWTGTEILFEISQKDGKTVVHFTHLGLTPTYECYDLCSNAWGTYVNGSLKNLITTGVGQPNSSSQARTETESMILDSQKK